MKCFVIKLSALQMSNCLLINSKEFGITEVEHNICKCI